MKLRIILFTIFLLLLSAGFTVAEDSGDTNNSSISPSELTLTTDPAIVGSITPKSAEMGSPLSASILVMNNGPAPAKGIQIDYYLIRFNETEAQPIWLHQKTSDLIPAFYQQIVPFSVTLPGGIEPGLYSLFTTISTTSNDRNLTNNKFLSNQPIDVRRAVASSQPGLPDLSVTIDSVSSDQAAPGYPFTINYTISNKGSTDAGTFHVGFYLSPDPVIEPSDFRLWDEVYYHAYPGMKEAGSSTDIVPSGIQPGDYYLGAIVDFTHMVQETDEESNTAIYNPPVKILDLNPPINEEFLNKVAGYVAVKTNAYRQYRGLSNLSYDLNLGNIARAHSTDMAIRNYFAHETPEGVDPTGRALLAKYDSSKRLPDGTIRSGIAENIIKISSGYTIGKKYIGLVDPSDPDEVADVMMIEWISSPEHNKNLVDPDIDRIGVGVAYNGEYFYGTQDFY